MNTAHRSFFLPAIFLRAWSRKLPCLVGSMLLLFSGCNSAALHGGGMMDMTTPSLSGLDPSAQPELQWALRCGSVRSDSMASHDVATDAAFDDAGNVYITGSVSGSVTCTSVGVAVPTSFSALGSSGGSFVAKLTPQGLVQWVKSLGSVNTIGFETYETKVAVRPDGVLYISGYSQSAAKIDAAAVGGERFLLSLETDGRMRWLVPVSGVTGGPAQMKITSLHVTQAGGQYTVQVGGLCKSVSLTSPNDCPDGSQYIWSVIDGGVNRGTPQRVHLFPLAKDPDLNQGVFDIGDDELGRLTWVGGNTVGVSMTGIMPSPTGTTAYLVRRQAEGQWSGGFVLQDKQVAELSHSPNHDLPWLNDSIRYGTRAYFDRQGNTYIGTLFNGNMPMPWIRKFGLNGSTPLWEETIQATTTANDFGLGFIGIRGDHDEHPIFAAHVFSNNRLNGSGYALNGPAAPMGTAPLDYDILIWKLDRSGTEGGMGSAPRSIPLWTLPTRISLGSKSLVGFDVHRPTNRMVVLSRTAAVTVRVDGQPLPALTRPENKKDGENDLALFLFAPKTTP